MDAECVDGAVGDEDGGVDSYCFASGRFVGGFYGCGGGDEACETKRDTGCYCDLAEEVEPFLLLAIGYVI